MYTVNICFNNQYERPFMTPIMPSYSNGGEIMTIVSATHKNTVYHIPCRNIVFIKIIDEDADS